MSKSAAVKAALANYKALPNKMHTLQLADALVNQSFKNCKAIYRKANNSYPDDDIRQDMYERVLRALKRLRDTSLSHSTLQGLCYGQKTLTVDAVRPKFLSLNRVLTAKDNSETFDDLLFWELVQKVVSPRQYHYIRRMYVDEATLQVLGDETGISRQAVNICIQKGMQKLSESVVLKNFSRGIDYEH